ncbi:hypothetical protein ACXC9Q_25665 (plasmid) [Kribbella sp. CWNU-51]
MVGYSGQYYLAARIIHSRIPVLDWIRCADPSAGVADDFQFKAGSRRHAIQVKWSQYPTSFQWSSLVNPVGEAPALLTELARAWVRLRQDWTGPLTIHLCTNDYASTASPPKGTPLSTASVDPPRHFAAFISRSWEPLRRHLAEHDATWSELQTLPLVGQWSDAWDSLRTASALSNEQFVDFLRDFSLSFVPHTGTGLTQLDTETAADVASLAAELQAIVADPSRPVELSREQVLERLGWTDRLRYRHPHRFPVPETYTANAIGRTALEERLRTLAGGYIALVGPAGSGKSTLLESSDLPGRVVHYYAFVPDSPDPLSGRGEAASFFHDLSLALEEGGLHRQGYGSDLHGQRAVLLAQLDRAGRRFAERGEKTIIVIDGLDHIPREQSPTRSLLDELPSPTALDDGVYIILGSQTIDILPAPIETALNAQNRTVELPPLASDEVRKIAEIAGVSAWLLPGQITALVAAAEGHPLALTYILQDLCALESEHDGGDRRLLADSTLSDASSYGGDIEARYRGYLGSILGDSDLVALVGAVSRLRGPVNLDWLATWTQPAALTKFTERASTFFHRHGREWRFIHNSFRRFLADETARIAGQISPAHDQALHADLADRCAESGNWPAYRDEELAHRFLAGQYDRVLEAATPQRLRATLVDARPAATVREHTSLALRAASESENYPALLRGVLFTNELAQRELVLEPKELARAVAATNPEDALEHVVRGGALRLESSDALELAANFAASGDVDAAGEIVRAAGSLRGLVEELSTSGRAGHEWEGSIADWAEVTWHRSGLDRVLDELNHLLPHPSSNPVEPETREHVRDGQEDRQRGRRLREAEERRASVIAARNLAHARCFDLADAVRDDETQAQLAEVIDAEAPLGWRARVRVVRAVSALADGQPAEVLRQVQDMLSLQQASNPAQVEEEDEDDAPVAAATEASYLPLSLRLQAAEALIRAGLNDAPEVDALVPPGTTAPWPSAPTSRKGLEPFLSALALDRLRRVHPDHVKPNPDTTPPSHSNDFDRGAGTRRFKQALSALADLEGQAVAAAIGQGEPPTVAGGANVIVRLLEVPPQQTLDWTGWHDMREAAPALFARLVRLCARCGPDQFRKLIAMFEEAWRSQDRAKYWPPSRRQAVLTAILEADATSADWVVAELGRLDAEIDQRTFDPYDRVSTWLKQSEAWGLANNQASARSALKRAVQASWGPGQHDDDRQLATWLDWLHASADHKYLDTDHFLAECRDYASRLSVASNEADHHASTASQQLIQIVFNSDAALACTLAENPCERGVMDEAQMIESVLSGAIRDTRVDLGLVVKLYTQLFMPIVPSTSSDLRDAIRDRDSTGEIATLIERAELLWEVPAGDRSESGTSGSDTTPGTAGTAEEASPTSAALLLADMRQASPEDIPEGNLRRWTQAADRERGRTSRIVAAAILSEARRLQLTGAAMGAVCALAAEAGDVGGAEIAIGEVLARTPAYGWIRHYDGGTRFELFRTALSGRHPALIKLAARDLAGAISGGSLLGQIFPTDLRRLTELIGGVDLVASAWPDIRAYLDEYAPVGPEHLDQGLQTAASPAEALLRWTCTHLGHPVRPMDFGAREVLQTALEIYPEVSQLVLGEAIATGGWTAEAALLTLVTASGRPDAMTVDLRDAVVTAASDGDAINRSIAARLLKLYDTTPPRPPARPLLSAYRITLPPLATRSAPELDREGVPHLDRHDPRQLVAPFDLPLVWLAEASDLSPSALIYHAAALAAADTGPWTSGGHRAQASRQKRRGNRHSYRPWAYMAGRRALAQVLGDLVDAELLTYGPFPAYELGFVDEKLVNVQLDPLDGTTPLPWRPEGTSSYDVRGWSEETQDAADAYVAARPQSPYVLAELSEWCSLEWGRPREVRKVKTRHPQHAGPIVSLPAPAWEDTYSGAMNYPARMHLDWHAEELVIHAYEADTDSRFHEWLAVHPHAAIQLGWQTADDEPFKWIGPDGAWRARTVRRVRGLLSHQPPVHTYCAEVWQVVLSDVGRDELVARFPSVTRTLHLERTLPASRRESRPHDEVASARVRIDP